MRHRIDTTVDMLDPATGLYEEVQLPIVRVVCPRCEGYGTHLNPNIGEHAYSVEEFHESFDEEEAAEYFKRGGRYDVRCEECDGANVVDVVDEDRCTPEQLTAWHEYLDAMHEMDAAEAAERRMGA